MASNVISAKELVRLSEEQEAAKEREALARRQALSAEGDELREAFMAADVDPDTLDRVSQLVRSAAERGEREVLVARFPSAYCSDRGRAINNYEPGWPETLSGRAKRGYQLYDKELRPLGYKLHAQIVDFPGGMPGDVGLFLSW